MKTIIQRDKSDIFSFSLFKFLFKNKTFLFLFRLCVVFVLFYAILLGFTNPTKKENIFTTAIFWGFFWPFFMVLSLSTFGRVFCGICPHGFLGKYITSIGLNKKMPKFLANPFIGLGILFFAYWCVVFIFPKTYSIPYNTAMFFTLLTIASFIFYFLYKDMSYCKYICPIGSVTKVFSKASFTKLETYNEGCTSCKTFDCAKACSYNLKPFTFRRKNSMQDCTLCMDCAVSCENVSFSFKKPSSMLFSKFKTQKVEIWTVLILTSILSFGMTFHHALNRTAIAEQFIWNRMSNYIKGFNDFSFMSIDGLSVMVFSIIFVVGLNIVGMYMASKIIKLDFEKVFYTLSYALIPLFIIGGLSHALEFFITHHASNILNAFNQTFSLGFGAVKPFASRGEKWLLIFHIFTHLAYIWAFVLMYYRLKVLNISKKVKLLAYPFASIVIVTYMALNFYTGYVFKTYGVKKSSHHHSSCNHKYKYHLKDKIDIYMG